MNEIIDIKYKYLLFHFNNTFDGDVIYCLVPMNQTFIRLAWEKFNPRNAMYISRDNGYFNANASMQRDTLINANTLARLGRENYTQEEIAKFDRIQKAIKAAG